MSKAEVWTSQKLEMASGYLLRVDEELAKAVLRKKGAVPVERLLPKKGEDLFGILARSIVYQQLSGASAFAIWNRFLKLGGHDRLHAQDVAGLSMEEMRAVGLSRQKGGYLKGLAADFVAGKLSNKLLSTMTTEQVTERLMSVRGIGRWTTNMFEIFHLGRQDVLPIGDLAVLRGIGKLFKLDRPPTPKQAEALTEHWKPYRSLATFYVWVCL